MEENLRPETPPVNPDLAAVEGCMDELTRPNSESSSSSSLTVDNLKDTSRHNANAGRGKCTAWTNEKHNLYLNRLESSFVDQLNRSMGLLTWRSEQKMQGQNSSQKLPVNTDITLDQFTVLQDGCWQKINFERNQTLLKTESKSHDFSKSPWTCYFRCAGRSANLQEYSALPKGEMHSRGKRTFPQGLAASLDHQFHQGSDGNVAEVSDQNFVDGDWKEKSSDLSKAKRVKKAAADSSSQDQIVPSGKFHVTSTLGITSPEREEQLRQEWSLENIEGFVSQECNVKSFLRES
ncbi:hypothetical protein LguiA_027399 [Lonicera macranthoides]